MDKVRHNIQDFISRMQAKYKFSGLKFVEFGVGHLDFNKQLFGKDNEFLATDVYETPFTDQIADITEYPAPFPPRSFDVAIVSEVLEHVFDYGAAFSGLSLMIKSGGYVIITTPWEYPEHGEDYWRYSEKTIDLLLKQYGFEPVERMQGWDGEKKTNIFRLAKKL